MPSSLLKIISDKDIPQMVSWSARDSEFNTKTVSVDSAINLHFYTQTRRQASFVLCTMHFIFRNDLLGKKSSRGETKEISFLGE